jgi:hypothetical protein
MTSKVKSTREGMALFPIFINDRPSTMVMRRRKPYLIAWLPSDGAEGYGVGDWWW